jgi:chromosome segregation ATPase
MFRFFGRLFRWAAIAVVLGVIVFGVIGKTRVQNAYYSVRDHLRANVDELVDTRRALRREIRDLQEEYPERIADLRTQLREVERDLAACEADQRLAREVVTLCRNDVAVLEAKLAGTEGEGGSSWVEFRSERLRADEAVLRAGRIADTETTYLARLDDLERESEFLRKERGLLRAEVAETEREYRDFQAEVGTMLREIDALKRKEKLVKMAERRGEENDDVFAARASSLAALRDRIARRKTELDERLAAFRTVRPDGEYEARARLRLTDSR